MEEEKSRELKGFMNIFMMICGVALCAFQIFTLGFYMIDPWKQQSILMVFIFSMGFLIHRSSKKSSGGRGLDILLMFGGIAPCIYILLFHDELLVTLGSTPETIDFLFGCLILAAVLELTRRSIGLPMFVIAILFLLYGYFGNYLPGLLGHSGFSLKRLIGFLYSTDGIFTTPLMVMTIYIYLFLLFGAFFEKSGVGKFIIDVANALAGGTRGGPAKVATWASCLFGMISGSAIANVMTTGAFTIPMMKRLGYSPTFAGAVEATASTGGQIMPPIMGAAAFILAEFVNLPYAKVMVAAFIPGFLYYACLFCQIDLRAVSQGLKGMPREGLP
ncbi:MAG: TRAP transporter fused permease subunit, partial [Deltaproteobacteria bacterium]|nr:TRAP transporter fused permease subunit [Deltaproteobacteria bacterium]